MEMELWQEGPVFVVSCQHHLGDCVRLCDIIISCVADESVYEVTGWSCDQTIWCDCVA